MRRTPWTRREFLGAAGAASLPAWAPRARAQPRDAILRPIPATGELLPAIGVGTWITFNVGNAPAARGVLTDREEEVLRLVQSGLANKQIGRQLGISERTVKRDWQKARAFLYRELFGTAPA